MNLLTEILDNRTLRVTGLGLFLWGALGACVYPYQSLVAINEIHLSATEFSLILMIASISAVGVSLFLGIVSDRKTNRRKLACGTALIGVSGLFVMTFLPSKSAFFYCNAIAIPAMSSIVGQFLTLGRLALSANAGARTGVISILRAAISLAFLCMLLVWGAYFSLGGPVMVIYRVALITSLLMTVLIYLSWPVDGKTAWEDRPSGLSLTRALREIATRPVMIRLLCMGAMTALVSLYMALTGLIFAATPARQAGDTALYIGIVAGWEVPFMVLVPLFARFASRTALMAAGGALYALHILLLPLLAGSVLIWPLTILAGGSGALMFSLQIVYLQDLLHERPGTGAALLALQKLVGDVIAASVFAAGTALGGYLTTSAMGCAIGLLGAVGIVIADRRSAAMGPAPEDRRA